MASFSAFKRRKLPSTVQAYCGDHPVSDHGSRTETRRSPGSEDLSVSVRNLTYAELAEIWGVSKDAARKKVEGLRLPRTRGNDGRARVTIDLEEVTHTPKPCRPEETRAGDLPVSTGSPPSEVIALQARIAELQSDLARERSDRERDRENLERERAERRQERERVDCLTDNLSAMTRDLARIVEDAAIRERELQGCLADETARTRKEQDRLKGEADAARRELAEWRARSWWRRLAG